MEHIDLSRFLGKPYYYTTTPVAMDLGYQLMKRSLEQTIKDITADMQAIEQDPAALKAFLKPYKIPKQGFRPVVTKL